MIPCDPEYGHLRHRPIADLFSALHLPLAPMLQFSVHEQYLDVVSNFKCSEHFYIMSMVWLECRYLLLRVM